MGGKPRRWWEAPTRGRRHSLGKFLAEGTVYDINLGSFVLRKGWGAISSWLHLLHILLKLPPYALCIILEYQNIRLDSTRATQKPHASSTLLSPEGSVGGGREDTGWENGRDVGNREVSLEVDVVGREVSGCKGMVELDIGGPGYPQVHHVPLLITSAMSSSDLDEMLRRDLEMEDPCWFLDYVGGYMSYIVAFEGQ